jgi:type I restriction-modification system DNA methylase subunit
MYFKKADPMPTPPIILDLVERFERNRLAYHSGRYNEMQLRLEFLDPLFEALGWDVYNKQGYAEAYKDVIHEDAIQVGEATKAPDYAFRIGGARKFFVEAKKPSVRVKDEISPAFQLRRYAWSAHLPLSILTDFEEFAVYDCRSKPDKTDKASTGRVMFLECGEYLQRWDEIPAIFSREAVLKGSFDKYAESTRAKHGTAEVDEAFLEDISRWREGLAHNIALRNSGLTQRELNYAVQMTIDRIIFLRISEDRGVEFYGRLLALLNGGQVYERLSQLFREADYRYNSGLFHFRSEKGRDDPADDLSLRLAVDDKPLKDLLRSLYYPDSPYVFSQIPADILGQVYEQFLGKVIRLTEGHRAVIEDKPEVKKAGGVFYTPTYIVEYIVKNTVGAMLEGRSAADFRPTGGASKAVKAGKTSRKTAARSQTPATLRILDPACGSGSFLLGAYQYLLDWYRDQYVKGDPYQWAKGSQPPLYQSASGDWRLTSAERKRILLDHIYGVDIDPQAVEVTKLSLLLKVLEGENEQTLGQQLAMFHERALPDLGRNIQCGNSLIGPDFYQSQQIGLGLFEDEERYRINAFDWQSAFPQVFPSPGGRGARGEGEGGFDVVIGNPPYIRMEAFKNLKIYLKANYTCHDERSDLYAYFIEQAHKLLDERGRFGMIVSNKFLRANYGRPLREFLSQNASIERIVDFAGLPVFKGATVRTIVLITALMSNGSQSLLYSPPLETDIFEAVEAGFLSVEAAINNIVYEVPKSALRHFAWSFANQEIGDFLSRIKAESQPLVEYCGGQIYMGIKSGLIEAFVIDAQQRKEIIQSNPQADEIIKPFLNGRDVRRYLIEPKDIYLIYTYHGVSIANYPAVEEHLKHFKNRLKNRATRQEWYELQQPQYNFKAHFEGLKLIFPDIATAPRFALDDKGYYASNTVYFIPGSDLFLLGLLNSKLAYFYFRIVCAGLEGKTETYLRFFGQYLEGFPIAARSSGSPEALKVSTLVERMLSLHQQLAAVKIPSDKTHLQRQIEVTDPQIDALVYQLYGLSDAEIALVEAGA